MARSCNRPGCLARKKELDLRHYNERIYCVTIEQQRENIRNLLKDVLELKDQLADKRGTRQGVPLRRKQSKP